MREELQRLAEAVEGNEGEAFRTVRSSPRYRLGVGARHQCVFFVEVIVDLLPGGKVDLRHMERCVALLSVLQERSYVLSCGEGRTVSAERELTMNEVEGEAAAVEVSARAAMG
jgi:hypothetical protein